MGRCYPFKEIEAKWQKIWKELGTFRAPDGDNRPKYYVLDMFPYPSGAGLHIGHPEGYTASDILARYRRACGYNVLHPMGWDAFGLPAEQHALQTGISPKANTGQNVERFRSQIQRMGFAIDWEREISTIDENYYRWTQWIFLQLFKHGLAFVDERPVWWCPELKAVLANEEVINGRSERGNHPVERRQLRQWVLRITAYADRLLEGLERLDWPDSTKRQQRAWIGRSEGVEIEFAVEDSVEKVTVYTTRADTLMGVTYLVLAPEHPLVEKITLPAYAEAVANYRHETAKKGDLERTDLAKGKTGVPIGARGIHPLTGEKISIWLADYVLPTYGTGAVMAVPAHDGRDYEFAQKFHLPIRMVIGPQKGSPELPFCDAGVLCNSGAGLDGLDSKAAKDVIVKRLEGKNLGRMAVKYKLRDWLFSRQRYWGEPIPIVWVSKEDYGAISQMENSPFREFLPEEPIFFEESGLRSYAIPLPSSQLPLVLPVVDDYRPSDSGESPLSRAKGWVNVEIHGPTGEIRPATGQTGCGWFPARRETNTMPQWAGSCWYHLRYLSPRCTAAAVDPTAEAYWRCPDFYIGGAEHAVLHLLYARFWHQFLYDIGTVTTAEPYPKLFHQGIILGEDGSKMSKSRGNVVNPDRVIDDHGADALRLYEMFLGPLEAMKPWDSQGIIGITRFLQRVWRWFLEESGARSPRFRAEFEESAAIQHILHSSIKKVREDIENLRFNTAISQLMVLLNHLQEQPAAGTGTGLIFLQLLAPFAPHIAEEIWQRMDQEGSIMERPFPNYDEEKISTEVVTVVVQVNGRLRGELRIASDTEREKVLRLARADRRIEPHLSEREIVKEIYVPNRLVNFVVH
ncbi:MAG: leucine--tRNA ligase [Puniceicoccales bacterium]|jgi:leucyl-tRNA synthetase|nr:leucine--tRNA ligase [Puniceicoccales bacterium]